MSKTCFFLLAALLMAASVQADPRSSFDEGLRLYRTNDISGAITHWENAMRQGAVSGPLLFNLGNAYYRSGQIGKSILYYERARRLMPRDRDVKVNLDLVRLGTVDKIEKPIRLVIWNWVDTVRDHFSLHELGIVLSVLGFLALGGYIGWRYAPTAWNQPLKTLLVIVLMLYGISIAWYSWRSVLDSRSYAIIITDKTDVSSAPDAASTQLFSLHEGTKVRYGEILTGWANVQLADGRKGWVPTSALERI